MKKCYLITTAHLEDRLWFLDEKDFAAGMNFVAIQAFRSKVIIVAFILMSNHLHIVAYGRWEDIQVFVNGLKSQHSTYLHNKYGYREFLRRNNVDIREINDGDESMERAIAYVQMNSVAANICSHPTQYPWGTGTLFFSSIRRDGTRLGDLSRRARIRFLHSEHVDLPPDWLIGEDGYILPESYVNTKYVESLYRTPQRMNYFLSSSSKARKRIVSPEDCLPAFRDQTVAAALPDLLRSLFNCQRFDELSTDQQVETLRQIRFRFSADVNQVARVTGLAYETAAKLLDKE